MKGARVYFRAQLRRMKNGNKSEVYDDFPEEFEMSDAYRFER